MSDRNGLDGYTESVEAFRASLRRVLDDRRAALRLLEAPTCPQPYTEHESTVALWETETTASEVDLDGEDALVLRPKGEGSESAVVSTAFVDDLGAMA